MGIIVFCDHCGTKLSQVTRFTFGSEHDMREAFDRGDRFVQGVIPAPKASYENKRQVVELGPCCADLWMKRAAALCTASNPKAD